MIKQNRDASIEMVNAILEDEMTSPPAKQLIKAIFKKQQEILIALEAIARSQVCRNRYTEKRLDELLEKVIPIEEKIFSKAYEGKKEMGQRLTQRIYACDICGKIPDDGEYMWQMSNEVWCEECCNKNDQTDNKPFEQTGKTPPLN